MGMDDPQISRDPYEGLDYDEFNITRLMPFVTTHSICLNSCSCSSFFLCLS